MIKQLLIPLAAVALFIILVGVFSQKAPSLNLAKYLPGSSPLPVTTMTLGSKTVQVEIANTQNLRTRGLSGRNSLAPDAGMFFTFDSKQIAPSFWMKNMLIPLDLIWISGTKIVKIDSKVSAPSPGTPDGKLITYTPGRPIDYVLEVNSGFAATNGIKVGDPATPPAGL